MSTNFAVKIPNEFGFITLIGIKYIGADDTPSFSVNIQNLDIFEKLPDNCPVVALNGDSEDIRTMKDIRRLISERQAEWLKSKDARDYMIMEKKKGPYKF